MANVNDNEAVGLSQNKQIESHLRKGGSLTQMEALELFHCLRLASRINDLRNKGMDIVTEKVVTPSGKIVAQYYLRNV